MLFLVVLGLRCCAWALSRLGKQGLLFIEVLALLIASVSLLVALRLYSAGSVVVVHGVSYSKACGIFLDQGLNPCPLLSRWILYHWATREAQGPSDQVFYPCLDFVGCGWTTHSEHKPQFRHFLGDLDWSPQASNGCEDDSCLLRLVPASQEEMALAAIVPDQGSSPSPISRN